jgi:hypothetical protein
VNATHSKALAVASVLLALPALSSCAVSFGAQTDQVYTPADGENNRDGTVDVLNALIVSETPGSGRLIAGLSNADLEEADSITGVRALGDSEGVTFSLGSGETEIPAGGYLQLADDDAAHITVSGDPEQVEPGAFVRLEFTFQNGEGAELNVPVLSPGSTYDGVELGEPTQSPSETPEG